MHLPTSIRANHYPSRTLCAIVRLPSRSHPREEEEKNRKLTLTSPMRTLFTALILYHRFKLHHPLIESSPRHEPSDAPISCLFLASKIEDTLQKSRELLAALHAIKNPQGELIPPDSPLFEAASTRVLGLERMLLESACFDFRTRDPGPIVLKFGRVLGAGKGTVKLAVEILFDIHRTLSVLKASPQGIALAALLLADRLEGRKTVVGDYARFETNVLEVSDIMDETLDLWIEPEGETEVGSRWTVEKYVTLRLEVQKGVNGNGVEKSAGVAEEFVKPEGGSVRFILEAEREKQEQLAMERWDGTGGGG